MIYCIDDFVEAIQKIRKKNKNYPGIEKVINEHFQGSFTELCNGLHLFYSPRSIFIKKRLEGKGGFRIIFLAVVSGENIFLSYIHPKTGPLGSPEITEEYKRDLYKKVTSCSSSGNYFTLEFNEKTEQFVFTKARVPEPANHDNK